MRCCEAFVRGINSGSAWEFHVISADNKDASVVAPLRPEEAKFLKHGKVRITPAIDRYIAIPPYALRAIGIGPHEEVVIVRVSSNHRNIRLGKQAAVSVPENLRTSGTKEFTVTTDARGGCRIRLTTLKEVGLADKPAYTISLSEGNAISVSAVTTKKG